MKTIEQAKSDKEKLQTELAELVRKFETEYGEDTVVNITIERWNGSNAAFGKVSKVRADVRLC